MFEWSENRLQNLLQLLPGACTAAGKLNLFLNHFNNLGQEGRKD